MSGEMEVGKCEVCGKGDKQLNRKYFYYEIPGIKCSCCSPNHFVLIRHCSECEPKEPEYTKVEFKTKDLTSIKRRTKMIPVIQPCISNIIIDNPGIVLGDSINELVDVSHIPDTSISVEKAMKVIMEELMKDQSPNSWHYTWKSNLACVMMDNIGITHKTANMVATKFLDLLCKI